ncbi:hypothetical protein B0A54_03642 [Friedmanniomyces endolithicus]|uniref:Uncharacterized protein n=1 Tax=Friedmanniomyces endolithicus TaxID=329885 RepID=A0A4U0VAN5_9PEZI|nr:hypothetical protein B0A54_03642 [Friedmanniomyces endolithicus]
MQGKVQELDIAIKKLKGIDLAPKSAKAIDDNAIAKKKRSARTKKVANDRSDKDKEMPKRKRRGAIRLLKEDNSSEDAEYFKGVDALYAKEPKGLRNQIRRRREDAANTNVVNIERAKKQSYKAKEAAKKV